MSKTVRLISVNNGRALTRHEKKELESEFINQIDNIGEIKLWCEEQTKENGWTCIYIHNDGRIEIELNATVLRYGTDGRKGIF